MVNVAQYQIVATGSTVSECEQKYVQLLGSKGITTPEERPQTEASGVIAELRSAVLDGNTYYFIRLEGEGGVLLRLRLPEWGGRDPQCGRLRHY